MEWKLHELLFRLVVHLEYSEVVRFVYLQFPLNRYINIKRSRGLYGSRKQLSQFFMNAVRITKVASATLDLVEELRTDFGR